MQAGFSVLFQMGYISSHNPLHINFFHAYSFKTSSDSRIMADEIASESSLDTAFKAPLKPNAPILIGRANWAAWSQAIKKCLNQKNLYFALHERAPYEFEGVPRSRDLRENPLVRKWVEQTQGEEVMSATRRVQRKKYARALRNDVKELARADGPAMEIILERIGEEVRNKILPNVLEGSMRGLWAKFERMHMDASLDDVDTATATLERLTTNQLLSVETRAAQMTTIKDDLASWAVELPDAYLIILFLRGIDYSLKERFNERFKALSITWDEFKSCFSSEESGKEGPRAESAKSEDSSLFFSE
jgi:hypothetical protein